MRMDYTAPKNVKLVGLNKGLGGPYAGMTEDGMFTDGHYAVLPTQKDSDTMPATIANGEKMPSMDGIIGDRGRYIPATYDHITQTTWSLSMAPIDLLAITADGVPGFVYIQRRLADVILSRWPGATLELTDKKHCVLFTGPDGFVAGLVMPFLYT